MNILMVSWRGPGHPLAGGAEVAAHEHAKFWVKSGNSVTLFTSYFEGVKKTELVDGVKVIHAGDDIIGVRIAMFFWYIFGQHQKFDLVVDEFHGIPFFTPIYVRANKLAFIHEVAKEVWWFNPWPKPLNLIPAVIGTVFERFIFSFLYKKTPFMTVSESTKRELMMWGIPIKKITVIHNGINTENVSTLVKEKIKTAVYLGALSRDKGIEDAIKIFSKIYESDVKWQFWVIGKGDKNYIEYLKNLADTLKIKDKVKFWGFINQKKKFELLARSHVLVNPSIREGWGLVNIEANSVGTPVVGFKVPGMVDSVKSAKTGFLVEYGNTSGIAERVHYLLKNSKVYSEIRQSALAWSKKFTWEKSCKESLQLIEKINDRGYQT